VLEPLSVTRLLQDASGGNREAFDRLVPLVYETLRRLAHRALRNERSGHTLSTTALAHEAYLELVGLERIEWRDRSHFFAVAARAMRRILIDYAVSRNAQKRGAGVVPLHVDDVVIASDDHIDEMVQLDEALGRLEALNARAARIVECRVFVGMTISETAAALDTSPASVKRQWNAARAWLTRELSARAMQ
jgi:RNA polymerase sigma factor (TIGR02999 family)